MDKLNKQIVFVLLLIGTGIWFVSWNIASINKQEKQYNALQKHAQEITENLVVLDNSLQTLSADIQQLHLVISGYKSNESNDQLPQQVFDQFSNADSSSDINASHLIPDDNFPDNNSLPATIDMPTAQELKSVSLIVEKLRTRDTTIYADFPSLLSSPEIVNLGPAAMDKIMAEVARMYEDGEIDPSFFPGQE